ncbi:uncharacterized protein [Choristoneura fumiferana]|uniref:uncharacterized protein n=1 Tax=Choristoneura fumiferana TaxID=7141 RepID=UPI003D15DAA5
MTVILCFVLLFFNPSNAELSNKTSQIKPLSCEASITCPAIVAPLCLRVIRKNQTEPLKKSIHIVVVNKCELQYMKCHQDVEAAVVPMKNCESGHRKPSMPVGLAKKRVKRQADLNPPGRNNIKGVYPFGTSSLLTATNNTNARRFWIPVLKAAIWSAKAAAKAVATHTVKKAAKEAVKKVKKEAVKKAKKEFKKKAKEEAKKRAKEEAEEIIAEEAEEIAEDIEERSKHIGEIAKQIEERAKKIKEVRNVMKLNAKSVKPGKNDKDDQNNLNRLKLKKPKQSRKPPTKKPKPRPTKAKPTKPRRTKAKPTKPKPTKVKPTVPKPTKPTTNQGGSHDIEVPVEDLDREEDNEYSQLKKKRPTRRTTKKKPKPTKPKTMKPKTTTPKHIETTKNSSGSKNINVSVDVSIEVVHPTEKSTQEDGLTLEEGIGT